MVMSESSPIRPSALRPSLAELRVARPVIADSADRAYRSLINCIYSSTAKPALSLESGGAPTVQADRSPRSLSPIPGSSRLGRLQSLPPLSGRAARLGKEGRPSGGWMGGGRAGCRLESTNTQSLRSNRSARTGAEGARGHAREGRKEARSLEPARVNE
jgi:hypothetical protein